VAFTNSRPRRALCFAYRVGDGGAEQIAEESRFTGAAGPATMMKPAERQSQIEALQVAEPGGFQSRNSARAPSLAGACLQRFHRTIASIRRRGLWRDKSSLLHETGRYAPRSGG